jgi:biopolymer transport protein ExbD
MSKIKKSRVSVGIDMTPLVDVAFLLLTFFMLTTQFKPDEDVKIELPMSNSPAKLPETDVMTIFVDKSDSLFLGFTSQPMMESFFGADFRLRQASAVKKAELGGLLMKARAQNRNLRTVVKTDANNNYGIVSDILEILQKTQITRFSIVTNVKQTKK